VESEGVYWKKNKAKSEKEPTLHFLPSLTASLTETTVTLSEPNSKPPEPLFQNHQNFTGGLSYRPILFQI